MGATVVDDELFDIQLSGVMLHLTFHFQDFSRVPGGDGWGVWTHIPPPLDRRFRGSGENRREAAERLISVLHASPEVLDWATRAIPPE